MDSAFDCYAQACFLLSNPEVHSADIHNHLRAQFENAGIVRQRLLIISRLDGPAPVNLHNQIDIALDTFPHNGVAGTAAAVGRGVPVVTPRGDRFAFRIGASLLTAAGLSECIAHSERDYIVKAATLASNPQRLRQLRTELPAMTLSHGLTDVPRFARTFEKALLEMATAKRGI